MTGFAHPHNVVVVGASLAGLRAVQAARESGFCGKLTLIGAENHLPYDRPPLSKDYLAEGPPSTAHVFPESADLAAVLDIDLQLGTTATGIDVEQHTIVTTNGEIGYDALLVATGLQARQLPGPTRPAGVHVLRTLDDARAIRTALDARARTVIIGAGFIGAEIASAAVRRGLAPVVIEAAPTPLVRALGTEGGAGLARMHHRHGVEMRCGVAVSGLIGDDHVEAVRLSDGSEIPADLVIVGIGATPATGWLASSGLDIGDGLGCDASLRAGPDIWAAGDVARWHNPLFGRSMRLEHWTNACEQAAHAMQNLLSPADSTAYQHVPYFWSDWYGQRIQFAGLPIGEPTVVAGGWDSDDLVALYREDDRLIGALTVNRRSDITKYRVRIARRASWSDALEFAAKRNAAAAAPRA